jgi:amidase
MKQGKAKPTHSSLQCRDNISILGRYRNSPAVSPFIYQVSSAPHDDGDVGSSPKSTSSTMFHRAFALSLLWLASTTIAIPSRWGVNPRAPVSIGASQILTTPYPYDFPVLGNVTDLDAERFPMKQCHGVTLEEATIDQLQDYMSTGRLTTVQIVLCYMERILQTDDYVEAIMELNPDFLSIAAALDAERAAGNIRGKLHGIPFVVKDNIASKDRMETTAGSWVLLGSVVPRDAHVVKRLRESGALLLGKATLSEWADMRSNSYSEGYSARGGQARSPYNLT